jgi:hypothetical protein
MVEKNDKMVLEYRQELVNNRRYKGAARFVKEFVPSWLSHMKAVKMGTVVVGKTAKDDDEE